MITFVRTVVLVVTSALVATVVSSVVDGGAIAVYPDNTGCEHGCRVAAAGWHATYLIYYPCISRAGAVSLTRALLRVEKMCPFATAVSFCFWLAGFAALALTSSASTSRS